MRICRSVLCENDIPDKDNYNYTTSNSQQTSTFKHLFLGHKGMYKYVYIQVCLNTKFSACVRGLKIVCLMSQ